MANHDAPLSTLERWKAYSLLLVLVDEENRRVKFTLQTSLVAWAAEELPGIGEEVAHQLSNLKNAASAMVRRWLKSAP